LRFTRKQRAVVLVLSFVALVFGTGAVFAPSASADRFENVNARDNENGMTPLMRAAMEQDEEAARKLIENGADVNARDGDGRTALMLAQNFSMTSPSLPDNMSALLISSGADVNARDKNGRTALFYAVDSFSPKFMIPRLLASGADPNVRDHDGNTVLILVADEPGNLGSYDAVAALIEAGADVNARNDSGETALISAVSHHKYDGGLIKTVYLLLSANVDVNIRDAKGNSALDYAREDEEFMKMIAYKIIEERTRR
jgi:ankyrin repeat protein